MRSRPQVALVTGGGSGFGRATSLLLASQGFFVSIADINEETGRQVLTELEQSGGRGAFTLADISTGEGSAMAVGETVNETGTIDVLVNNAGIAMEGVDSWEATDDTWDRILRVNLKGMFLCSRAAIPVMKQNGGGSIINVASIAASSPAGGPCYAAAKGGMLSYTRNVASGLARFAIRVNCVSPGFMDTPMTRGEYLGLDATDQASRLARFAKRVPSGRVGTADDIAGAVSYLASDRAAYITGQELVVDGGFLVR
ncbi:MAG: SDR family NAD(P)-dependent oxidoreductase [Actinomycetota bacterium]|nr:SDR family NAD(P)-dependent oxidoreductase [Actinomycetota bacterium]